MRQNLEQHTALIPTTALYDPRSPAGTIAFVAGLTAAVAAVITIIWVARAYRGGRRTPVLIAALGWTLVPPVWFWCDYFQLYRRFGTADTLELFKYGQQVSAAIWAAIAVTLGLLSASDHFKGR